MRIILALLGLGIIVLTVSDLLWTTFLDGAGPLSKRLCNRLWHGLLMIHRRRKDRRAIAKGGLLTVCSTLVMWGVLLWIGWGLVFNGSRTALVSATANEPA